MEEMTAESSIPSAEPPPRVFVTGSNNMYSWRYGDQFTYWMDGLRNLIPNPIKKDRASIVKYAIEYIKELSRMIEELKVLVERKQVQRKSEVAEVDVQIAKDDVTIKLVQKKKNINCLLFVSKVLDQLQLELHHVAGEQYTFLLKTKVCEGSCVHANVIADIILEMMEKQNMDALSTQLRSMRF